MLETMALTFLVATILRMPNSFNELDIDIGLCVCVGGGGGGGGRGGSNTCNHFR